MVHLEPLQELAEEPWRAYLQLLHGKVTSCQVQRKSDGQLLWKDAEAMQWLETKEGFSWNLEESSGFILPSAYQSPRSASNPGLSETKYDSLPMTHQLEPIRQEEGLLPLRRLSFQQKEPPLVLVPQRTSEQTRTPAMWPREYRRVFSLIDGRRTSVQIASLLHWPSERVVQVLRELQARRLIEL